MNLSPTNFLQLIASHQAAYWDSAYSEKTDPVHRSRAIECWRCADCEEIYDDEREAEECCAPDESVHHEQGRICCPVCAADATGHRDAADCCLWKDMDAPTRWAMADQVEAGAYWVDLLQINRKDITQ